MIAQVARWGNSLALRIPASLAQTLIVKEGHSVELTIEDHRLVVTPLNATPTYQLAELLSGITADNLHEETDFGAARDTELLP